MKNLITLMAIIFILIACGDSDGHKYIPKPNPDPIPIEPIEPTPPPDPIILDCCPDPAKDLLCSQCENECLTEQPDMTVWCNIANGNWYLTIGWGIMWINAVPDFSCCPVEKSGLKTELCNVSDKCDAMYLAPTEWIIYGEENGIWFISNRITYDSYQIFNKEEVL